MCGRPLHMLWPRCTATTHCIETSPPPHLHTPALPPQTARAKKDAAPESATDKVLAEEADMMRHITQKQALRAAKELATDTIYTRSMSTGWKPPAEAREQRGVLPGDFCCSSCCVFGGGVMCVSQRPCELRVVDVTAPCGHS